MNSGIYAITSPSGNQYVGSAVNFKQRWRNHLKSLRKGDHHNAPLQAAYVKYGEEKLCFAPILICSKSNLIMYEQLAIDALRPKYNICLIAGSSLGLKQSESTVAKRVIKNTGKTRPMDAVIATASANRGMKRSDETRAKLSIARKQRITTDAARQNMSRAQMGRKHTDATKKKRAASLLKSRIEHPEKWIGWKMPPESVTRRVESTALTIRARHEAIAGRAIGDNEKLCVRCSCVKPLKEFGIKKTSRDGLRGECKMCRHISYLERKQR